MKFQYKKHLINISLVLGSVFFVCLLCEGLLRLHLYSAKSRLQYAEVLQVHDRYGWRPMPGYRWIGDKIDASGAVYSADVSILENGFRRYDDLTNDRPRIFLVGDSYTHAVEVSDNKTYYSLMAENTNADWFVYGCWGWSSLQEFLLLDDWMDEIKPDLVLWQFCPNDILNNTYALERNSMMNNNRLRRPYLNEQGDIYYALPLPMAGLRHCINQYSKLGYKTITSIDALWMNSDKSIEHEIAYQGEDHPLLRDALKTTKEIMHRLRKRCGEIPIIAFSTDTASPYNEGFQAVCNELNIPFTPAIPLAIQSAMQNGETVHAADKMHWNERGHQIGAETLLYEFPALLPQDLSQRLFERVE